MIDHTNHYARYDELMALAARSSPSRRNDGGYMAALYILSADPELYKIAGSKISQNGINFRGLLCSVRKSELSDSQIIAVHAAHSLFNGDGGNAATPSTLALCDYSTLDIVTDAVYIWKGGRTPVAGENGCMHLDNSNEQRQRAFETAFDRLHAEDHNPA